MAISLAVPKDRVRIFTKDGFPLAEFRADVERSNVIGEEGRALFEYPSRKTNVVNDRVLRPGNWILVENSRLPSWLGVIDLPREESPRATRVYCYDTTHVFGWRRGTGEGALTGSAGYLFSRLIQYTNEQEATIIRVGEIDEGGDPVEIQMTPKPLSHFVRDLYTSSGEEYAFRPMIDPKGNLVVFADWTKALGVETSAILQEGARGGNLERVDKFIVHDGPIVNDWLGYGDGETWPARPKVTVTDANSRLAYGLRQDSREWVGMTSVQALTNATKELLTKSKNPNRVFQLVALNRGNTWDYCALGNRVILRSENANFGELDTVVRILGIHYDPMQRNRLPLIVEEWSLANV